jgi:hypothetical protein
MRNTVNASDLDGLRYTWRNRQLVLFLGAGVSTAYGLPSWKRLVLELHFGGGLLVALSSLHLLTYVRFSDWGISQPGRQTRSHPVGAIVYPALATALGRGYAAASTNTGHDGGDASFVPGHPEKLVDFAYRAVHEMTAKAKAVTEAYYGKAPARAYWNGCSSGGKQGLKVAVPCCRTLRWKATLSRSVAITCRMYALD